MTTTGIVLLLAPWGPFTALTLFYLLGYLPFAGLVLVVTWRREAIGPAEAAHLDLDARTIDRIRAISAALGASLVAVAIGGHFAFTGYLPAAPFLVVALLPAAARVAAEALEEARRRPVGTLILLNVLNLLDAIMSDAAIGAGVARELNPLVMAVGAPAKLALVAVLSGLVYWKRPRALTVPAVVFVALIAYHLTGLLGALAVGQG